jgi:hypothetical protein
MQLTPLNNSLPIEFATEFYLGEYEVNGFNRDVYLKSYRQKDRTLRWVIKADTDVLSKAGEWVEQARPEFLTGTFLIVTRFGSAQEAYDFWVRFQNQKNKQTNG